ncbi:TetR/AcrR family transcriptional regulator [Rhizobium sp. P40RR-XXII]|uniref:TetR/AcrR family transcriptional regulator n=1 Tax=unclassified Rhizobium TaxID=2613769 RepID=UPI0014576FF2|nr:MULTISPECIES: TetR/AcrR family transcriptional regulator [unclassified Rhizobium]NLR83864.1 TetR/AcrR family transcriptional regulator [Rhizobium sp. P28RR-XV]NLS15491.1 TetR/AcrR family transcriptional regulator [Rhizobium sp. P40RR-XXII]
MATPKQIARRERIEEAAYAVLKESGYKATSLLAIARRASVSNETLYNWYGNKQALFRSLIESNAREAKELLAAALQGKSDPLDTLAALGPILLSLVTGDKAIVLNRAAAGDVSDTRTLGPAIAQFGRDAIAPLLRDLLQAASRSGLIACGDPTEAADIYFRLLIGDLQVRRVICTLDELPRSEIERRASEAMALFLQLHAPADSERPLPSADRKPSR